MRDNKTQFVAFSKQMRRVLTMFKRVIGQIRLTMNGRSIVHVGHALVSLIQLINTQLDTPACPTPLHGPFRVHVDEPCASVIVLTMFAADWGPPFVSLLRPGYTLRH